jgi:hypothetical protein
MYGACSCAAKGVASEGLYDLLPAPEPRQLGYENAQESPHLEFVKERLGARWKADFPVQQFESWKAEIGGTDRDSNPRPPA